MYDICVICENLVVFDVVFVCCGDVLMFLFFLEMDVVCCVKIIVVEIVQVEQNKVSKFVGVVKVSGDDVEFECFCVLVVEKKVEVVVMQVEVKEFDVELIDVFVCIVNVFVEDVLDGVDEDDNVEINCWGEVVELIFVVKEYYEIVGVVVLMDFDVVVKIFGVWFVMLKGVVVCIYRVFV